MRKADYMLLAQLIREHVDNPAVCELAREFAKLASVDRDAFLKACGLT